MFCCDGDRLDRSREAVSKYRPVVCVVSLEVEVISLPTKYQDAASFHYIECLVWEGKRTGCFSAQTTDNGLMAAPRPQRRSEANSAQNR
jgi:hypothetical protein